MLLTIHELKDKKGKVVSQKKEIVDEKLYDEMKSKKEKLIQQLKTEKVVNPKCQSEADDAIEEIKKKKCGYGKVGRVEYYYESLKGMYFYIHKVFGTATEYTDSTRFYCSTLSETMYEECRKSDPLLN